MTDIAGSSAQWSIARTQSEGLAQQGRLQREGRRGEASGDVAQWRSSEDGVETIRAAIEQFAQEAPAAWARFVGRYGEDPQARLRALEAARQAIEQLVGTADPAHFARLRDRLGDSVDMVRLALTQFERTEADLGVTPPTLKMLGTWAGRVARSGEDAANVSFAARQGAAMISDGELIEGELRVLGNGDADVRAYQQVVEMVTHYYQDLTKALAATAKSIKAGKDANYIEINVDEIAKQLQGVIDAAAQLKVKLPNVPVEGAARQEWLKQWRQEFGAALDDRGNAVRGGPVVIHDDGNVTIDPSQVEAMLSSLGNLPDAKDKDGRYAKSLQVNNATYQSWQTARDTQRSNVQTDVQTLLSKFQNRQSMFDNLIKLLSNTINQLAETRKQYMQY
jgi:invasin D